MEALAQAESGRTLNELESYFQKYCDLPREVVLKHDLLRDGHWFTDAALELASDALVKSYRLFSYDLIPMKEMKRKEHRKITEWFTMRGGHYGLRPVTVQTTLNSNSPYVIDAVDGKTKLFLQGKEICDVSFPRPLKYYSPNSPTVRRTTRSSPTAISSPRFATASTGGRTKNAASAISISTPGR